MTHLNEVEEIGYCAFKNGAKQSDNPFSEIDDCNRHCEWSHGWEQAKIEEKLSTQLAEQREPMVKLIKDNSIDPDYGFIVEIEGGEVGSIVGLDFEYIMIFKQSKELMRIAVAMKLKQTELFQAGLLG
jgi:hypothetical protein